MRRGAQSTVVANPAGDSHPANQRLPFSGVLSPSCCLPPGGLAALSPTTVGREPGAHCRSTHAPDDMNLPLQHHTLALRRPLTNGRQGRTCPTDRCPQIVRDALTDASNRRIGGVVPDLKVTNEDRYGRFRRGLQVPCFPNGGSFAPSQDGLTTPGQPVSLVSCSR